MIRLPGFLWRLAFVAVLAVCPAVVGGAGGIDPSFPPTNVGFGIVKVALQSDSKIVVGGTLRFDGTPSPVNLLRLKGDGTIDASFPALELAGIVLVPGVLTNAPSISALSVEASDGILVGGSFVTVSNPPRTNIVRLKADGTVDPAFKANVNNTVLSIAPLAGGKVLVGGNFDQVGGAGRKYLARLNADGSLDAGFNPAWSSPVLGGPVQAIAVQADGKILVAGGFTTFSGTLGAVALVRFNDNGTPDTSFKAPTLPALTQSANAIAVQADGSVVLAGTFSSLGGVARSDIARLSSDGTVDPAWGGAGVQGNSLTDHARALLRQPDGKILLGGTFGKFSGVNQKAFVRLNVDGTIDSSLMYTDGSTTWAVALALQPDGNIVAAGTFTLGTETFTLLRILGTDVGSAAPVISTQPIGQTVTAGATVNLTVVATGGASLTYQWFHDGVALPGETHSSLGLFNVQGSQGGTYDVVVSNGTSSTQSSPALLVVNTPPVISAQPIPLTVAVSGTAKFIVSASGTAPLSYQWSFEGSPLDGETNSTLTLTGVQASQAGKYRVVVHNPVGDVPSVDAALTVNIPPPVITRQPQSQTVAAGVSAPLPNCSTLNAANLPGAVFTMTVLSGAAPFASSGSYQVTLGRDGGVYQLSANGINPARNGTWHFGPDLGIATVLTVDGYFADTRVTHWALLGNCEYELYADNLVSSQHGTYAVSGGTSSSAGRAKFSVEATGTAPVKYQWYRNNAAITGAIQAILEVPSVSENAGSYYVVITDAGGSTQSDAALLTVTGSTAAAVTFTLERGQLKLGWPAGYHLQSSASLSAPSWQDAGVISPKSVPISGRQQFFRLVQTQAVR